MASAEEQSHQPAGSEAARFIAEAGLEAITRGLGPELSPTGYAYELSGARKALRYLVEPPGAPDPLWEAHAAAFHQLLTAALEGNQGNG